jgi:glycerol uptake facilitator protein
LALMILVRMGAFMAAKCFGEFMGTLVLVLLGDGVVANVLLKKSKAEGAGWIVIASGWGVAVMAGVFVAVACGSPDAHINPAVTLGFAVSTGNFVKLAPYIVAQLLGALVGAALVWLHFLPHWRLTEDTGLKLACFCTAPAVRNFGSNLLSEIIGTLTLVFVTGTIFSKAVAGSGFASGIGSILVAALVWGIGLSLGGPTGYAINPARDFGPRLAHALLPIDGKGKSDWAYAVVPILGPFIGGGLAGLLLRTLGV